MLIVTNIVWSLSRFKFRKWIDFTSRKSDLSKCSRITKEFGDPCWRGFINKPITELALGVMQCPSDQPWGEYDYHYRFRKHQHNSSLNSTKPILASYWGIVLSFGGSGRVYLADIHRFPMHRSLLKCRLDQDHADLSTLFSRNFRSEIYLCQHIEVTIGSKRHRNLMPNLKLLMLAYLIRKPFSHAMRVGTILQLVEYRDARIPSLVIRYLNVSVVISLYFSPINHKHRV